MDHFMLSFNPIGTSKEVFVLDSVKGVVFKINHGNHLTMAKMYQQLPPEQLASSQMQATKWYIAYLSSKKA